MRRKIEQPANFNGKLSEKDQNFAWKPNFPKKLQFKRAKSTSIVFPQPRSFTKKPITWYNFHKVNFVGRWRYRYFVRLFNTNTSEKILFHPRVLLLICNRIFFYFISFFVIARLPFSIRSNKGKRVWNWGASDRKIHFRVCSILFLLFGKCVYGSSYVKKEKLKKYCEWVEWMLPVQMKRWMNWIII